MNTVSSPQSPLTGQGPGSLDLSKNLAMVFGTPVAVHQWPDSEAVNAELGTLVLAREAGEGGRATFQCRRLALEVGLFFVGCGLCPDGPGARGAHGHGNDTRHHGRANR